MDANDAASYVQELTGEEANIIFGAMYDDTVADYCRITVIATGLNDDNLQQTPFRKNEAQLLPLVQEDLLPQQRQVQQQPELQQEAV